MARIFISHSSKDSWPAAIIHARLEERGWGPVFLDIHPERGLKPGQRWEQALAQASQQCVAVVCLLSDSWAKSAECRAEYTFARYSNEAMPGFTGRKLVIPVMLEDVDFGALPAGLSAWQATRPDASGAEILHAIELQLSEAGLSAESFQYNPQGRDDYSPFRGLKPLDENDAAILFGRDAEIAKGLRAVQQASGSRGQQQVVTFKGPSGSGKSSLMRAGVLARLRRDKTRYIVLPTISPAPLGLSGVRQASGRIGLICAIEEVVLELGGGRALTQSLSPSTINAAQVGEIFKQVRGLSKARQASDKLERPRTIIIAIDQAEEFLTAGSPETGNLMALMDQLLRLDENLILIQTVRSDAAASLQRLSPYVGREEIEVKVEPLGLYALAEVVTGPASVCRPPIEIDPELLPYLFDELSDSDDRLVGDSLPLVAVAFHRLYLRMKASGANSILLSDYVAMGGARGVISDVLTVLCFEQKTTEARLASAIVPQLVDLRPDGAALRRLAGENEFDEEALHQLELLVPARLIIKDEFEDRRTYSIAHEALFRIWASLAAAVSNELPKLEQIRRMTGSAEIWSATDGPVAKRAALIHSGRDLRAGRYLLSTRQYGKRVDSVLGDYLAACETKQREIARNRLAAAAALAVAFGMTVLGYNTQRMRDWAATSARATSIPDATLAVVAARPVGSVAIDLGGKRDCEVGPPSSAEDCLLRRAGITMPVISARNLHSDTVERAYFDRDASQLVTLARDNWVVAWSIDGDEEPTSFRTDDEPTGFSASGAGHMVVSDRSGKLYYWQPGKPARSVQAHQSAVLDLARVFDNEVASIANDGTVRIWRLPDFSLVAEGERRHAVAGEFVLADITRGLVISAGRDGRLFVFDKASGKITRQYASPGHKRITAIAYDNERGAVVIASDGGLIEVWDIGGREPVRKFTRHAKTVRVLEVNPTSGLVASGDENGDVFIWKLMDTQTLAGPLRHRATVTSLDFSEGDDFVASGSLDGSARIWDIDKMHEVYRAVGVGRVFETWISKSDASLVAVGQSGSVQIRAIAEPRSDAGKPLRLDACARPLNRFVIPTLDEEEFAQVAKFRWPWRLAKHPCDWRGLAWRLVPVDQ